MVKIRTCDELMRSALMGGKLRLFYFPVGGQEAVAAALGEAVERSDYLVSTYRGLHDEIAKGAPLAGVLAEMMGRGAGVAGGKGGPMHICDPDSGVMLTSGIVGAGPPMANGLAMASQLRGDGRVTICSFGDGAINTGSFHEALNLAAVWELPVVFLCQNNRYAETTRTEETYRLESVAARGGGYGMPAVTVDGFDPVAMHSALADAVDRARSGGGPSFVEAVCYRYFGHFFGDPMPNVPQDELAAEMAKDPIPRFAAWLAESGSCPPEEVESIAKAAEAEAAAAFDEAFGAAAPLPDAALADAYASPISVR
jgi:pyruvate dehydrogenase E1 component alpha subunit